MNEKEIDILCMLSNKRVMPKKFYIVLYRTIKDHNDYYEMSNEIWQLMFHEYVRIISEDKDVYYLKTISKNRKFI